MSDIFQEVDEALRRDQWLRIWQRYGTWIIAFGVAVVLITAGIVGWRDYDLSKRQTEGARYATALELAKTGKYAEAAALLNSLASDAHDGRALIARFESAALRARGGDQPGALAAYEDLTKDGSIDSSYRDLAVELWAVQAIGTVDPQSVLARLQPLTDAANPWHVTAIELTAIVHLKTGDRTAAKADYQKLADDLAAPPSARARAAELVSALGP